jgi:hypothetical protein
MKTKIRSALLVTAIIILAGCASPRKEAAYGHEQEFRQQLAESVPVKDYGYSIQDLRFTEDYQKALVVFVHPDSKTRPTWEFTLASDDFGRYQGRTMQPFYTPGTGNTPAVGITVDLHSQ